MTLPGVCPVADRYQWLPPRIIGGYMPSTRGLVFHVNAGNGNAYNWFLNPAAPIASSHFQLMKSGELIQGVRLDTVAWCQVAGSATWHSIETEGWPNEPLTEAALDKMARLYAWGSKACGWKLQLADSPAGYGLGTHQMGGQAWGGHQCPGDIRAAQRGEILRRAAQYSGGVYLTSTSPAPAAKGYPDLPTIDLNAPLDMAHEHVRTLQALLQARGGWIAIDNKKKTALQTVVRWFQQAAGLTVDLVVGPQTWGALVQPRDFTKAA